jgi:2'-5' RNA ligase
MSDSAVVVRIGLPPAVDRLRRLHDETAARGVAAHVTLLFPFLPAEQLTRELRKELAACIATESPFTADFTRVERRANMVWLLPAEPAPFLRLTQAIAARWPEYPPYGGAHAKLVPHLTVLESADDRMRERAELVARASTPVEATVRHAEVIIEDASSRRWQRLWSLPLGD